MSVRNPKDDEEELKARLAIAMGKGKTIKEFIQFITDDEIDDELVEAIKNRIKFASESDEVIDVHELITGMLAVQGKWI
jgi:divalent metal cation (Fe/Co/Zn/Cd) transporter